MNIDERLELLTLDVKSLVSDVKSLTTELREFAVATRSAFTITNRAIGQLLELAHSHEARLDRLEGKVPVPLEGSGALAVLTKKGRPK